MSLFYVLARVVKDVSIRPMSRLQHPTTYIIFFRVCRLCESNTRYSLLLFHQHVNERLHQYRSENDPCERLVRGMEFRY
jgi:hypothetical protein